LFYLSLCHLRLGQPARAREFLTQCRARRPRFLWTYFLSGLVHESLRDYELAEADYQQALALGPTNEAACVLHVDRGRLRFRRGDFGGAIDDLKPAIARRPDHFYPYLTRARVYQKRGKWQAADEQLRCAIQLQPPAPQLAQCLLERARTLYLSGK